MKLRELQGVRRENFLKIKCFILRNGGRRTYGNKWSNNPHYGFPEFDAFLDPGPIDHGGPGRWDVEGDPAGSDFNTLVIRTKNNVFHRIRYARNSDGIQMWIGDGTEADQQVLALDLFREILNHVASGVHQMERKRTP